MHAYYIFRVFFCTPCSLESQQREAEPGILCVYRYEAKGTEGIPVLRLPPFMQPRSFCSASHSVPLPLTRSPEPCVGFVSLQECAKIADGGPFRVEPPAGGPPHWGEGAPLTRATLGGTPKVHDVRGPLFLLVEAEALLTLERKLQDSHRAPERLPFVQGPHRQWRPHGGPHGTLLGDSQALPLRETQWSPKRAVCGEDLVGQTALKVLVLLLDEILGAKEATELLEDLVVEETAPFSRLFPSCCLYNRAARALLQLQQRHKKEQQTVAGAAATLRAEVTDGSLTYVDDFHLWSPLAGHFQQIQPTVFKVCSYLRLSSYLLFL